MELTLSNDAKDHRQQRRGEILDARVSARLGTEGVMESGCVRSTSASLRSDSERAARDQSNCVLKA